MTKGPIVHVTDHAVVRYLERVEHHDVDLVRDAIRHRVARAVDRAMTIGLETCAVVAPEATYQIVDGVVVTVLAPGHPVGKRWPVLRSDEG